MTRPRPRPSDRQAGGDAASADDWEAKADAVKGLIDAGAVTRDDNGMYVTTD
jgi:hypothetical protein